MFLATGRLLPGSVKRPCMATLIDPSCKQGASTQVCRWNRLGYIPVVSIFTGFCRVLLGTIHTIVHLVAAIFDKKNRSEHLKEAELGARNIVRGVAEMLPFLVNNIVLIIIDYVKAKSQTDLALEYKKTNEQECENNVVLFIDGEAEGKKSIQDLEEHSKQHHLKTKPDFWEIVNLIQSKA